jgi:hypothetical protein
MDELKTCTKCKCEFPATTEFFYKHTASKDGLKCWCKNCSKKYHKENSSKLEFRIKRNEYIRAYSARPEVREKIIEKSKEYYSRPERKEKLKEYYSREEVKERAKANRKKYRSKPEVKEKLRNKYASSVEAKIKRKEYRSKLENKERQKKYIKDRIKKNNKFRITVSLRHSTNRIFKNCIKPANTLNLIGCTYEQLIERFEEQFYPHPITGIVMTIEDIGPFAHIDHIQPLSSFELTDIEQQKKACHWSNLQVLWAEDNFAKSKKPYRLWLNEQLQK